MEFDELLITTGVDALVRLIREKGKIELDEASTLLNIPPDTIQEWARVLEEEGIIRLEYRLTKIHLAWVKPTEEEIAAEKESFTETKQELGKEVDSFRSEVTREAQEMDDLRRSFSDFYIKAIPRIEKLERSIGTGAVQNAVSPDTFKSYISKIDLMAGNLESLRQGVGAIRKEIDAIGIEKKSKEASARIAAIESFGRQLESLLAETESVKKKTAATAPSEGQLPSMAEFRKKFEIMKKDLMSIRAKNASIREDMVSLHESSEILKGVAESIMGSEEKVDSLKKEMAALVSEADDLMARASAASAKVKENADMAGRLSGTIATAKGVLTRFPSQENVMAELDKVKKSEDALLEKTTAMETLLDAAGGRQIGAKQFGDLSKKMDEKAQEMKNELESLSSVLEEEKATYIAFQKIKERIVPSLDSYQKQISDMEASISRIQSDSLKQKESLKSDTEKVNAMLKEPGTQEAMRVVAEIGEKKKQLDEVRQSIEELSDISENLTKRITLLSQQAKILEIRQGAPGSEAETQAKKAEMRSQLELSQSEEMEFRRKREELKNLIKKLWE